MDLGMQILYRFRQKTTPPTMVGDCCTVVTILPRLQSVTSATRAERLPNAFRTASGSHNVKHCSNPLSCVAFTLERQHENDEHSKRYQH